MSDLTAILAQSVERLFIDLSGSDATDPAAWRMIEEMGLTALMLPEAEGGMEGNWADAAPVFQRCGYHALPLPVGETITGNKLLYDAGVELPGTSIAFGQGSGAVTSNRFTGKLSITSPLLAGAFLIASLDDGSECILIDCALANDTISRTNMAGEPRGTLAFENAPYRTIANLSGDTLFRLGALLRTAQMAGALAACLEITMRYALERSQFGRELRKFQAIQHQIAILAEESAAIYSASLSATAALDAGNADFAVACAKLRANMATGTSALIAHQVHGAIGITKEYELHRFTNRLWAWRDEFGNDRFWAQRLGETILLCDAGAAWEVLTQRESI